MSDHWIQASALLRSIASDHLRFVISSSAKYSCAEVHQPIAKIGLNHDPNATLNVSRIPNCIFSSFCSYPYLIAILFDSNVSTIIIYAHGSAQVPETEKKFDFTSKQSSDGDQSALDIVNVCIDERMLSLSRKFRVLARFCRHLRIQDAILKYI